MLKLYTNCKFSQSITETLTMLAPMFGLDQYFTKFQSVMPDSCNVIRKDLVILIAPRISINGVRNHELVREISIDDELGFYVPFNSISVILGRREGEHERLCAMKRRLASDRISPPAGFEPETP